MVAANFRRTHGASQLLGVRTESNDAVHTIDTGTRIVQCERRRCLATSTVILLCRSLGCCSFLQLSY